MSIVSRLKLQIQIMQKEILSLRKILNDNNIKIEQHILENDEQYLRTIKSRQSVIRRVCIKCRRNLTLGKFSIIERRKGAYNSVCCSCVKNEIFEKKDTYTII